MALASFIAVVLILALALAAALASRARAVSSRSSAEVERDALRARVERLEREHEAERDRLDARARAAQAAAESAERARDELVSVISHELRTPLCAVLGWARLLRSGKLDPAGVARAVETLERSASDQAKVVDDLIDVARIERGEVRLDVRSTELVTVVEAAIAAVRPAAAARSIVVSAALMPGVGAVSGDPGRLQQVVWNLLANAVKFTAPGGRVEVRLDRDGGDAVVRVRDTGEGIPPEFLPHLFERFRQADSSSTRSHGGLGVGLAIVRKLVEAHGGTVAAESEGRGKGSMFTVRLPLAAAPVRPARRAVLPKPVRRDAG